MKIPLLVSLSSAAFLFTASASAQTTHINPRGDAGESGYIIGCLVNAWLGLPACGEFAWSRRPSDTNSFILPPGGGVLAPQSGGGGAPNHDRGFFGWLEDICEKVPCETR